MPLQFECSACGKKVRAPDEAAGKKCRCPHCQAVIEVPDAVVEAEEVSVAVPFAADEALAPPPAGEKRRACPMCGENILVDAVKCRYCGEVFDKELKRAERKKKRRPTAPAIALLVLGTLGLIVMTIVTIVQSAEPPPRRQFQGPNAPQDRSFEVAYLTGMRAAQVISLVFNVIIIAGSAAMLQCRFYGLAIAASILAMINVGAGCCIPGLPIGIWSLVVLMRPEVKAVFR